MEAHVIRCRVAGHVAKRFAPVPVEFERLSGVFCSFVSTAVMPRPNGFSRIFIDGILVVGPPYTLVFPTLVF